MVQLEELPPELWQKIYRLCKTADLVSVACCSKASYQAVIPIIWQTVKVHWKHLEDESLTKQQTKHLRHTRKLFFCGDGFFTKSISASYEYTIGSCDPDRLSALYFIRYPPNNEGGRDFGYLSLAALRLRNLRELWLYNIYNVDLSSICLFAHIHKLVIRNSDLADDNLAELHRLQELEELTINNCSALTKHSLEHISLVENLRALTFSEPHCEIHTDEYVGPVDRLVNLVQLNLSHSNIKDIFFEKVGRHLRHQIEVLRVERCYSITSEGLFTLARCWPALHKLNVSWCNRIANEGVQHFKNTKLKTLVAEKCFGGVTEAGVKCLRDVGIKVLL